MSNVSNCPGSSVRELMVMVIAMCLVANPLNVALADLGPCSVTAPAQYTNTSACNGGNCSGGITVVPIQRACAGTDSSPCTNKPAPAAFMYNVKAEELGEATLATCLGNSATCIACFMTAAWVCAGPQVFLCVYGSGICVTACTLAPGVAPDPCCWTRCMQDLTSKVTVPGGNDC